MRVLPGIGSIMLGSPGWGGFVLAVGIPFLVLLLAAAIRSHLPTGWKWGLFSLKFLAIVLLASCLLDPLITRAHVKPGENIVALLADDSASMNVHVAADGTTTRGEAARRLLDANRAWQTRLAQDFDVRRYTFGSRFVGVEGFQKLSFDKSASNLHHSLTGLQRQFARQPLAAVLLFTDGNSTDALPTDDERFPVPIFPVVPENRNPPHDLMLGQVSVSQTNFEDAPVTIQARIHWTGTPPQQVVVDLVESGATADATRQSQTLTTGSQQELLASFQVKPARTGALFYELSVRNAEEAEGLKHPETTREATLVNNRRELAVNRDAHVSRLLYVGGRPNWEHKFLGRALQADHQLELASLVRIARKEARFDFRGRVGEESNPLFRGFKSKADEETEDYSQPVLVRLNMRDAKELSDGFPKTQQELYQYEAVILDDVEATFFTRDQQSLLDRFVSERGGGLLMLGGQGSFRDGKWEETAVADALPVYLNRMPTATGGPFQWQLTREGWLEPWLRLRETEQAERARIEAAPPFTILTPVPRMKPGARLLAEVRNRQGHDLPALVVQQYGEGRAGALLVGDFWKATMRREEVVAKDPGKSWRQIARWLVADTPRRLSAAVIPVPHNNFPTQQIQIRIRDRQFQPADNAPIELKIRQPDQSIVSLDPQPSVEEAGLFEAEFASRKPGRYVAEILVPGTADDPSQTLEIGWTSDPAAEEFARTAINSSGLTELAERSGGRVIPERQLEEFVASLAYRPQPVMETETIPLWHKPWMLLIVLTLLAAEWGLRRWKGLA